MGWDGMGWDGMGWDGKPDANGHTDTTHGSANKMSIMYETRRDETARHGTTRDKVPSVFDMSSKHSIERWTAPSIIQIYACWWVRYSSTPRT